MPRSSIFIFCLSLIGLVALILVLQEAPVLLRVEHQTSDWRTALLSDRQTDLHPDVAVVLISEDTLADYPYFLPVDRGLLAKIVRALDAAGVRAMGLDFYFTKRTESQKDEALIAALHEAKAKIVLGAIDERGKLTLAEREFQRRMLEAAGRPAGFLNLSIERDTAVRYRAQSARNSKMPQSFAALLAEAAGAPREMAQQRIAWLLPPPGQAQPFLTIDVDALFPGTKAHEEAVARGDIEKLKNKVVLVGGDLFTFDRHVTPLVALGGEKMLGVFIHAHILAQLIDGRAFYELPTDLVRLILIAVALLAVMLGWLFGARHFYLVGWSTATAVLIAADAVVFSQFRIILPFTLLLVAWVLGAVAGRNMRSVVGAWRERRRLVT